MADELWNTLLKFHREIVIPDINTIVGSVRDELSSFKRETAANFDAVWKHFEVLDSEYHALNAAVKRIETKLES